MRAASTQSKTNNMPHDLVVELQLRLPTKSLFRFKSVSKTWGNQISDPCFQDMYHKRSKKSPNLLFCKSTLRRRANTRDEGTAEWNSLDTKTLSLTNSFTTRGKVLNMMVTCQGMAGFLGMKDNVHETQVYLYCLSTKKLLVLPIDSSSNFTKGPIVGFGLGYLPSIEKYKVSLLFMKSSECSQPFPNFNCQVIEISNNRGDGSRDYSNWRIVDEDLHDLVDCFLPPVFVENEYTIYWKAWCNDLIISFDVKDEKFQRLSYPNGNNLSVTDNICLVDLQGKLGLSVASTSHQVCFTMVIWKLQDSVNQIWEKTYIISLGEAKPRCLKPIRPMYLQDEEIIMYSTGYLMFYNLEKNTYRILDADVPFDHSPVGMYYESLHS